MPKSATHFSERWIEKFDSTENPCSRWLRPSKSSVKFFCLVCKEEKSCKNGGWSDVFKHSKRRKHLERLNNSTVEQNEKLFDRNDSITRAEVYWALATAKLGFSYNAAQNIQNLFVRMFPDSQIAKEFSMKPRKLSYVLSHGTGKYFREKMLKDLIEAPGYTLIFDETITIGTKKQLDLHFRYWCERKQSVVVRYYKSFFLGHVNAEIIFRKIVDSLRDDRIDLTKMLMLGRDNPNINKTIERLIDQRIRFERREKFVSRSERKNNHS